MRRQPSRQPGHFIILRANTSELVHWIQEEEQRLLLISHRQQVLEVSCEGYQVIWDAFEWEGEVIGNLEFLNDLISGVLNFILEVMSMDLMSRKDGRSTWK